jgi:periplasmic divalent cation tolerance protein
MIDAVFCYVTCADASEARAIAFTLVEERLAAGVNVIPAVSSVFRWQERIHEALEAVVILKTRSDLTDAITTRVRALHSYECPCIVVLPVMGGDSDYLAWIVAETAEPLEDQPKLA